MKKPIKYLIICLLILTVLLSAGIISYAAYTHSLYAQRTIAPSDAGDSFSSNQLLKHSDDYNVKTLFTEGTDDASAIITICNYPQGKQNRVSTTNIEYSLEMQLVTYNAHDNEYVNVTTTKDGYVATLKNGNDTIVSVNSNSSSTFNNATSTNKVLVGNTAHADVYTLTLANKFATANADHYYVLLKATPTDTSLPTLAAIFKAEVKSESASSEWIGVFTEINLTNDPKPADYDGYNYIISGYGAGTITLTWMNDKINMSYISLSSLISSGATYSENSTNHTSTIVFSVDSDEIDRYEIQFYKLDIGTSVTWNDLNTEILELSFR